MHGNSLKFLVAHLKMTDELERRHCLLLCMEVDMSVPIEFKGAAAVISIESWISSHWLDEKFSFMLHTTKSSLHRVFQQDSSVQGANKGHDMRNHTLYTLCLGKYVYIYNLF